jgi:hypothetical protein
VLPFRWEIKKIDKENIVVYGFIKLNEDVEGEMKNWMYLNTASIQTLCDCLTEDKVFKQSMPRTVSTEWDSITFCFGASRERPDIGIYCDHKAKKKNTEDGVLHIPLDTFGDRKKNMTYITPFVDDLKKYINQ